MLGLNWIPVCFLPIPRSIQLWRDLVWHLLLHVVVYSNDCIPKLRCQTYGLIICLEMPPCELSIFRLWFELNKKSWNRLEESFSALCAMIEVQSYLLGANIFNPFCAYLHIDKCWPTIITTHGIHNPFIITIENDHFAIVFVEFHKNEMDKDVRIWRNVLLLSVRSRNRPTPLVKVQIFADIYDSDASFYFFSRFVWSIKWLFWTLFKLNLKPEILRK